MFGIKKGGFDSRDFGKELKKVMDKKAYGIQMADEIFHLLCRSFQGGADCVVYYGYGGREILFRTTMPEDEAAFYRRDFLEHTESTRVGDKKTVWIWTENGVLCGMWVFEIHAGAVESTEMVCREIALTAQAVFSACLLAEELEREQKRDCVTGLYGNVVFEDTLRQLMEQKADGYLIVARRPVRYDGCGTAMNGAIQMLAEVCISSGVPDIYRIGEDTLALLCMEGQEKAYAIAQQIADTGKTDLYVTRISVLEDGKVYPVIWRSLGRTEHAGKAFGLHYPYPKLPIYMEGSEGGWNGKTEQ